MNPASFARDGVEILWPVKLTRYHRSLCTGMGSTDDVGLSSWTSPYAGGRHSHTLLASAWRWRLRGSLWGTVVLRWLDDRRNQPSNTCVSVS